MSTRGTVHGTARDPRARRLAPTTLVAAAAMLLAATSVPTPAPTPAPTTGPAQGGAGAHGGTMLVLGDSYASGEGLDTASGACGRSGDPWDGVLAEVMSDLAVTVLACSGAVAEDVTVGRGDRPAQLAEVVAPADVVLLTVGGNDVGFTDLLADCLGFAGAEPVPGTGVPATGPGWVGLLERATVDLGCDISGQALRTRIGALAEDDAFALDGGDRGGLAAMYVTVAQAAVADGGVLLVTGYPRLWEPSASWPDRYGRRCHGVRAADADLLAEAVTTLDQLVAREVQRANEQLGTALVRHVPLAPAFAGHGLCSADAAWINGLSVVEGGVDVARLLVQGATNGFEVLDQLDPAAFEELGARPARAYHPDRDGWTAVATAVAAARTP